MDFCYICDCSLNVHNCSEEHIFLNALGGKLKARNLLCKQCNSMFGDDIDSELARQFNFIANMLNIERDRGKPQSFDAIDCQDGTVYSLEPGGIPVLKYPVIKKEVQETKTRFTIRARDVKQWRAVAKGLKRKYPEIEQNKTLTNISTTKKKKYLDNELSFKMEFGGVKAFRSLCKSAINFYLYKNGNIANIRHLIPYVTGKFEDKQIVKPVYFGYDPISKNDSEVLHSIIIKGDAHENLLYAYIELFNFYKILVLLNDNYTDDNIEYSYFFDVITRKEVIRDYQLILTKSNIKPIMDNILFYKEMMRHLKVLLEKILRKQDFEHRKALLTDAMNNVMKKYPDKKYLDEEMCKDTVNEVMKQLTPWLLHRLKQNKDYEL